MRRFLGSSKKRKTNQNSKNYEFVFLKLDEIFFKRLRD